MQIDEAIRVKTAWRKANYPPPLADEINADNLSIEALKELSILRDTTLWGEWKPLPGETEE